MESIARKRQKQKFLDSRFIAGASISGVPTTKAALRSFRTETTANVNRHNAMQIQGFKQIIAICDGGLGGICEPRELSWAAGSAVRVLG